MRENDREKEGKNKERGEKIKKERERSLLKVRKKVVKMCWLPFLSLIELVEQVVCKCHLFLTKGLKWIFVRKNNPQKSNFFWILGKRKKNRETGERKRRKKGKRKDKERERKEKKKERKKEERNWCLCVWRQQLNYDSNLHPHSFQSSLSLSLSASCSLWTVSTKTCIKIGLMVTMTTTLRGRVFLLLFSSSFSPLSLSLSLLHLLSLSLYLSISIYLSLFHPIHSQGIRKYQRKKLDTCHFMVIFVPVRKLMEGNRFLVAKIRSFYSMIKSWINLQLTLD